MRSGSSGKGHPKPLAAARATLKPWSPLLGWVEARRDAADDYWRGLRSHSKNVLELDELRLPRRAYFDWQAMPLGELAVYLPNQVRHMIRADSTLGRVEARDRGEIPPLPQWPAVRDLAKDLEGPWKLPDLTHLEPSTTAAPPPAPLLRAPALAPSAPPSAPHMTRALSSVAAFLSVVLIMFRVGKRYKLSMPGRRRRPSHEWPLPDVIATRHTHGRENSTTPMDPSGGFLAANLEALTMDQPPSYSECARRTLDQRADAREAPPPPYSSCYVSFSDTGDRVPSVHFHNNPRPLCSVRVESGHSSAGTTSVHDGGRNAAAGGDTSGCDTLIFDNGRVIQRTPNGANEHNAAGCGGSGTGAGNNRVGSVSVRGDELAASADERAAASDERLRFISA